MNFEKSFIAAEFAPGHQPGTSMRGLEYNHLPRAMKMHPRKNAAILGI